ncbi:RNA pseudouridylate synthase domain-containing protein 1 isoform X1 [Oncorhynchus masou masou]|uniref:RNA pseudouridylate synthase domain-containing protein 1 isoform X1 n=1 Tax=Oncorhynchus masou masou TaxID=90313 RepID=UPI003183A3AF
MEPSSMEPSSMEPSSMEPSSMEPSSMERGSMEPVSMEPSSMERGSMERGSVEPSSMEPSSMEPSSMEPGSVDSLREPTSVQPGSGMEPGSMERGSMERGSMERGSMEPSSMERGSMERGSVEPGSVDSLRELTSVQPGSGMEPGSVEPARGVEPASGVEPSRSVEPSRGVEPASVDSLKVLYQSCDYIIVDKHWDIRIDSKMWYEKHTVQKQLGLRFPELADPGTYYGFRFCHQLDYSTSGVLCVALNKAAAGRVYHCFKDRRATKVYLALVRGWVEEEKITVDFSIGENTTEGRTHMMCIQGTDGCENPKPCQSQLTVLEYGDYDGDPVTKVVLQPLTGRTHQLRVHCEAVGHPIVGDYTYSLGEDSAPYRMMLHAHLLHLPLEPLPLQAAAPDPFTTPTDPRWRPQRRLRTVEGVVETLLEHRAAEERTEREEKKRQQEERRRQQEERRKRWRGREESEEQRRMCQQWLSEWTDV